MAIRSGLMLINSYENILHPELKQLIFKKSSSSMWSSSSSQFSDEKFFHSSLFAFYFISIVFPISLKFIDVPYGKLTSPGWGPTIYPPLGWLIFESPSIFLTPLLFSYGQHSTNPKAMVLMSPYLLHYFHRTIIYPLRLHKNPKPKTGMPVSFVLFALGINILNVYLQARWISHYNNYNNSNGLFWVRAFVGLLMFLWGMRVNIWADKVLMGLKMESGGGYKIPRGGWFDLVSCPNYLGEIMEWLGWSVMTWSWPQFGFFFFTCANLVPRAKSYHKWYMEKFGKDYPNGRKSLIPFVY